MSILETSESLEVEPSNRETLSRARTRTLDLSHFAYSPSQGSTNGVILRKSPRNLSGHLRNGDTLPLFASEGVNHPRKHSLGEQNECESSNQSPKKRKRSYATPETYAHLPGLQDWLKGELDVMFCGINPGHMSASTGHHYANPTNHFWRCLHQSTLTTRRLPPSEDSTLPDLFSLGLTNLVDRATAEQAELSSSEMADAVPTFLTKVARYRPRFVCFVGVGIWRIVEKTLIKLGPRHTDGNMLNLTRPSKSENGKAKKLGATKLGLQPYKLVYDSEASEQTVGQESSVPATFFFAVPSTSGRVVTHHLSDKVKLFVELKAAIDDYQRIDSTRMTTINVSALGAISGVH